MLRGLLRFVLVIVLVIGIAAFFLGYRWGGDNTVVDRPVGTTGSGPVDTSEAREAGAEIGETVAQGANEAQRAAMEAGLTAKIKAKMALDDRVAAAAIDVDTDGSIVTLTGRVASEEERARALQMARETDGVMQVVDRLTVAGQ